jgi:hypothetical protein
LVTDGRPFTWEEVGRMLMTFEGFTLDARIEDTMRTRNSQLRIGIPPDETVHGDVVPTLRRR